MLRGGLVYWAVFILSFFPFAIYQMMMRNGQAPQLEPLAIGIFAATTPIIGWRLGRAAEGALRRRRRYDSTPQ